MVTAVRWQFSVPGRTGAPGIGGQPAACGPLPLASGPPPGSVAQTKPIPGGNAPPFHYSIIPPFQFPASPGGVGPGGRGTRGNRVKRTQFGGVKCAKRSQFLDYGLRIRDRPAAGRPPCAPPRACAGQSCKTKPIAPARPGMGAGCRGCEAPPESDCAKRSQTWAKWDIWGTAHHGRADCAKRSQFRPLRPSRAPLFQYSNAPRCRLGRGQWDEGQMRKTNPIPSGAGWDEAPGTWGAGQSCETKPIREGVGRGRPTHSLSLRAGSTKSRSCETKPNLGGLGLVGKGALVSGAASPESGTCETNPICRSRCE